PSDLNLMAKIDYCGKLWQTPTSGNPGPQTYRRISP
ncbi:hypothetical protein A2U01_0039923, partial [Trifolium medium]|nr:hypothetical protein [Trifolium medium]